MMQHDNKFHYVKSQHLDQTSLLQAQMHDFAYGKHAHEEFSFGVTLAGRQDFFANGAFHQSHPGEVLVFNPDDVHDGHSGTDDALQYKMLYVHPEQLEPLLESVGVKQSQGFRVPDTLIDDSQLRQHILNMAALIEDGSASKLQQECELYQMAGRLAQLYGEVLPEHTAGKADCLLFQVQDYIQDNLHMDMSLDDISQHANLSKYHFLRLVSQQFGITPHQYVLNCRLNRVRDDLAVGVPLDDVVFHYKFSDLSHLNRRFKPVFGMTPKQFQRSFLN